MGKFNSDNHYIYYCGQEFLRRNRVAIILNKRVLNAVLECTLKNDRMISVRFQGKPFSITVIQVYAPTSNAEEAEVERFCEDLQDLLELTLKKRRPFHYFIEGITVQCKSRKSRDTWNNKQIWPWSTKRSRSKANRVLPREHTGHSKHPPATTQETTTHGHHQMVNIKIRLIIFFAAKDGSDHELLIDKFSLKLKKVGKTTRPLRYDLNKIPYDYTVEVRNRFKGLDLIECLKN